MTKIDEVFNEESNDSISKVPVLPLSGIVVFPYTLSPLVLEGEKSKQIVEKAAEGERLIAFFPEYPESLEDKMGVSVDLDFTVEKVGDKDVVPIGVLGRIVKMLRFPDGTVRVLVRGLKRIKLLSCVETDGIDHALVENCDDESDVDIETTAMAHTVLEQFQQIVSFSSNFPDELKVAILNIDDNSRMVDLIADAININFAEKLSILTTRSLKERLQILIMLLSREIEVMQLGTQIQHQVHDAMGKTQREYFLREQLKTIKKELGDGEANPDILSIKQRLETLSLPEPVREVILKETERLEMIPQASSEYQIAYTYIDWLLEVPWNIFSEDQLDVLKAAQILDKDHYGLTDIKERILDFLAVLQLKKDRKSPIICFAGPPGVGKTSLGRSIAKAMGREFVRISLGGVRDEAEIRGHRRTYVGALPGRLIKALKRAGTSNPVIMLDEIDKLGNDFRGDPSSALLEVLDPQQNHKFNDHYLEVDCDLSNVMFICTANMVEAIPHALRDRMDVISLAGYTPMEKKQIARKFLVPRQILENGLDKKQVTMSVSCIEEIISYYTREAGVRNLERVIGTVFRKIARKVVQGVIEFGDKKYTPTVDDIHEYLGPRKVTLDSAETTSQVGVAVGMAYTSVGGTILPVEATMMKGKGVFKLTGSLGDVMKESAVTAFSLVKSRASELDIDFSLFEQNDFHIHVPDGATPKDGPSAGVTLTTALVSLLTNRPVRTRTAMTGEITLRGKVTAIGGVKEKVIGALRAGIKSVLLPEENRKDLENIPEEVQKKLDIHFVSDINQVLDYMLLKKNRSNKTKSK